MGTYASLGSGRQVPSPSTYAVELAEGRCDEHRVMDLHIGGSLLFGMGNVRFGHLSASHLNLLGYGEQCVHLATERPIGKTGLHLVHEPGWPLQVGCRCRTMAVMTEMAIVPPADGRCNDLPLTTAQCGGAAQEHFRQVVQRLGGLWPEMHQTCDPG